MKRFLTCVIVVFFVLVMKAKAQDVVGTRNGVIHIAGTLNNSPLSAVSNDLFILLNYETAEFKLTLDKSTLKTNIDSIDQRLKTLYGDLLEFEGELGIDFIRTEKHSSEKFEIVGNINCFPHNQRIIGKGGLEHIFGDVYSCVLNMTFILNKEDLGFKIDLPGLANEIHVEIIQTILNRGNY